MALIVTPGEFTRRAEFYHQLQQLTAAGVSVVRSLEQLRRNPPSASYRVSIERLLNGINGGQTFSEALRSIPDWLPEFDIMVIDAGEQSGRMDQSFRMLGEYYTERSKVTKRIITKLAYPAFLLHLTAAVMALVFFFWYPKICLLPILGLFGIYVAVFFGIYAVQSKHGESWRGTVESFLNLVPMISSARRSLALARLAAALEALISAGVTIIEAWELAARASGSVALQRTVASWRPFLQKGQTPAEALNASRQFPDLFINQYTSGEISGKLDETLARLRDYYQEEGNRKVQILAQWVPTAVYLLILIGGGAFVIWFWVTYYGRMFQSLGI